MVITKKLKEDVLKYNIDLPTGKGVKAEMKSRGMNRVEYAYFLRQLVKDVKRLIEPKKKSAKSRERDKIKQIEKSIIRDKRDIRRTQKYTTIPYSSSQLQKFQNKLFYMSPAEKSFKSYEVYQIWNDRPDVVRIQHKSVEEVYLMLSNGNLPNLIEKYDMEKFLEFYKVKTYLMSRKSHKIWLSVEYNAEHKGEIKSVFLKSKARIVRNQENTSDLFDDLFSQYELLRDKYQGERPFNIAKLDIHVGKVNPLNGSSYIELPKFIQNKKACINIKNEDQKCFLYSVMCALDTPKNNACEMYHYKNKEHNLIFKDEDMPMCLNKIQYFEKRNNLRINVFGIQNETKIIPLHTSVNRYCDKFPLIHLLFLKKSKEEYHYCYIKNLDALLSKRSSKNDHHKNRVCPYCCEFKSNGGGGDAAMEKHMSYCISGQRVEVPKIKEDGELPIIKFKHYNNINECPIRIYADFETFNDKSMKHTSKNENKVSKKKTIFNTGHKPASFKILVVSDIYIDGYEKVDKYYSKSIIYKGSDADNVFVQKIQELENDLIQEIYNSRDKNMNKYDKIAKINNQIDKLKKKQFKDELNDDNSKKLSVLNSVFKKLENEEYKDVIIMSDQQKIEHKACTSCWICHQKFTSDNKKVRHHNHNTGQYHSALCNNCNIQIKDTVKIPVFFHNLNYDKNVFFTSLIHYRGDKKMVILPENLEKFKAFQIGNLHFLDSMRFLNSSLSSLIENVPSDKMFFLKHLTEDVNKIPLLTQKGQFPYEWFDDIEKLKMPISEIKREFFDNDLTLSKLSDDDWKQVQNVIKEFNIQTFEEYHDYYLNIDVNGLADVFENFRETSLKYYKLEPCHYVGTPSYGWDAMMLETRVKLESLTDSEMYLFYERGIRGGQSVIFKKYAEANNKYMKNYDKKKETSFISYIDANNLYGWAMVKKLPCGGFRWFDCNAKSLEEWIKFILNYDENDTDIGYTLEVDMEYPEKLHDAHNDYPLAPERLKLKGSEKLCGTFNDKKDYIVDIRNLRFYLEHGMKLTKVSRVIEYRQSNWLKSWIDKNTEYRKKASNEFERDYFKLMNNSVFGKTMENVRGRIDVKVASDDEYQEKYLSKPNFHSLKAFKKDEIEFSIIELTKNIVKLDKPIYAGFTILDLSKLHMYDFHYNFMKSKYGENIQLLMTDTDSFVYHIKTDDFYQDMKDNKKHFDMSAYIKNKSEVFRSKFYNNENEKVLGKFKDEKPKSTITEFVGVRSKCYSILTDDNEVTKRLKGITQCVVKKKIKHSNYKRCVLKGKEKRVNVNSIRTKNLMNYSLTQNKLALDNTDDKRYWRKDEPTKSYAYGHKRIRDDK